MVKEGVQTINNTVDTITDGITGTVRQVGESAEPLFKTLLIL